MKDHTLPEEDPVYWGMIMALSPGERVAMACNMFSAAKALVRAGIISGCGGREPADLKRRIFLRFYGSDFEPAELEKDPQVPGSGLTGQTRGVPEWHRGRLVEPRVE